LLKASYKKTQLNAAFFCAYVLAGFTFILNRLGNIILKLKNNFAVEIQIIRIATQIT